MASCTIPCGCKKTVGNMLNSDVSNLPKDPQHSPDYLNFVHPLPPLIFFSKILQYNKLNIYHNLGFFLLRFNGLFFFK